MACLTSWKKCIAKTVSKSYHFKRLDASQQHLMEEAPRFRACCCIHSPVGLHVLGERKTFRPQVVVKTRHVGSCGPTSPICLCDKRLGDSRPAVNRQKRHHLKLFCISKSPYLAPANQDPHGIFFILKTTAFSTNRGKAIPEQRRHVTSTLDRNRHHAQQNSQPRHLSSPANGRFL